MSGNRHWLWLLLGVTVISQAVVFAGRPMTSYRALELGATNAQVGLVTAAFALVPLLIAVPAGRAVDGDGAVRFLRWGAVASVVGAAALTAAPTLVLLGLANAVAGVGLLLSAIAAQGIIARRAPLADHDRAFGLFTVAASVGQMIGPLTSGAAATTLPWGPRAGLGAAAVLGVAMLALSVAYRPAASPPPGAAPSERGDAGETGGVGASLGMLRTRGMSPAMLASMALLTCVDLITAFLPVLAEERGISPAAVGWLLALRALASIASRLLVARLAARWGRTRVLVTSMLAAGAALLALGGVQLGAVGLVVLVVLAGFALGIGQPLTMSWVAAIAPAGSRATALAIRLGANRLGQVAVPATAGAVAGLAGPAAVFVMATAMLTAAGAGVGLSRPRDAG